MTAISVFSTFTNKHDEVNLQFKNLENLYMLSDSQISLFNGKDYKHVLNQQKIFFEKNSSVVMGIAGIYNLGRRIIKQSLETISNNNSVINATSLNSKIDEITKIVSHHCGSYPKNQFRHSTTIICNTVHDRTFATVKYFIPSDSNIVTKVDCNIMEKITVTSDGMDGKPFDRYVSENLENLEDHLSPATKHFSLFMQFLHSEIPDCSGPPCQGVVLNRDGVIKELSIKHPDGNFYKMGLIHQDRKFLRHEIDYRDENFVFLSSSKMKD